MNDQMSVGEVLAAVAGLALQGLLLCLLGVGMVMAGGWLWRRVRLGRNAMRGSIDNVLRRMRPTERTDLADDPPAGGPPQGEEPCSVNRAQLMVVWGAVAALAVMVMVPPWRVKDVEMTRESRREGYKTVYTAWQTVKNVTGPGGYRALWSPPEEWRDVTHKDSRGFDLGVYSCSPVGIDAYRLSFQIVGLLAVAAAGIWTLRRRKETVERPAEEPAEDTRPAQETSAMPRPRKPEIGTEEHLLAFLKERHIRPESDMGRRVREKYFQRDKPPAITIPTPSRHSNNPCRANPATAARTSPTLI